MKLRFVALALVLAWPSFAHAGWFNDTIGRPITGGLAQGVHMFKDTMASGAKQTRAAFGSAAHDAGLDRSRSNTPPPSDPGAGAPAAPLEGASKKKRRALSRTPL